MLPLPGSPACLQQKIVRRCFPNTDGQTMRLALVVSSSRVMNIMPLAEPGICLTSTRPAMVMRLPFCVVAMSRHGREASRIQTLVEKLKRATTGCGESEVSSRFLGVSLPRSFSGRSLRRALTRCCCGWRWNCVHSQSAGRGWPLGSAHATSTVVFCWSTETISDGSVVEAGCHGIPTSDVSRRRSHGMSRHARNQQRVKAAQMTAK